MLIPPYRPPAPAMLLPTLALLLAALLALPTPAALAVAPAAHTQPSTPASSHVQGMVAVPGTADAVRAAPGTGVPGAARTPTAVTRPGNAEAAGLQWPVRPRPAVERNWEPPASLYGPGHRGVDLRVPAGAVIRAAAAGRVTHAGSVAGRGVLVIAVDGAAFRITHEPVRATVDAGERVKAGDPVGVLENGPFHCDRPCLHFGVRTGNSYRNPLELLRTSPSRLLPVHGVPPPPNAEPVARPQTATALSAALLLLALLASVGRPMCRYRGSLAGRVRNGTPAPLPWRRPR